MCSIKIALFTARGSVICNILNKMESSSVSSKRRKVKKEKEPAALDLPRSDTRKQKVKKAEVRGETLLLNYTYYLDECHNRKVIVGFDPQTLKAKIVFHLHGRFPVYTDYIGWVSAYSFLSNLQHKLPIKDDMCSANDKVKEPEEQYKIPIGDGSITLHKSELSKLYDMIEMLNVVMFHYNNATDSVKEYYKKYCERCMEKNVFKLTTEDFFLPSKTSYSYVNYTRLFYEISFICNINAVELLLCNI